MDAEIGALRGATAALRRARCSPGFEKQCSACKDAISSSARSPVAMPGNVTFKITFGN